MKKFGNVVEAVFRTKLLRPKEDMAKTPSVHQNRPSKSKITSVHQNPATDNPFVAKNQNLYFRGRCIWFDF